MLKWIRNQMQQEEGLTLIELIVVVAIIAILAFTITPRVLEALNNSKINGARSVANELHSALERYYANKGVDGAETYPKVADTVYETLRTELGGTVGLTNTTTNVVAVNATNDPVFEYESYENSTTTATVLTNASTENALHYCIEFQAKDRDATWFKITPQGVEENATQQDCP